MPCCIIFFFFNDTATTEIYTLSLHDALPIYPQRPVEAPRRAEGFYGFRRRVGRQDHHRRIARGVQDEEGEGDDKEDGDRKSTRLNSSHTVISYAVFCLKKKRARQRVANSSSA